jgi:hypothetical protein
MLMLYGSENRFWQSEQAFVDTLIGAPLIPEMFHSQHVSFDEEITISQI